MHVCVCGRALLHCTTKLQVYLEYQIIRNEAEDGPKEIKKTTKRPFNSNDQRYIMQKKMKMKQGNYIRAKMPLSIINNTFRVYKFTKRIMNVLLLSECVCLYR